MATEYKRIVIKKGSGIPTIPASNDHTDGTWLATDLYVGEFYMDTATDKIYMRTAAGIEEVIYDVASFELLSNKATDFTTLNNTKYPTTQAVNTYIDAKLSATALWYIGNAEIRRGFVAQNNSTTLFLENIVVGSAVGTATAVSVSTGSELSKKIRTRIQVSTPALNGICSYRATNALHYVGTGFRFSFGFGVSDSALNTGARQFYGLTSSTTALIRPISTARSAATISPVNSISMACFAPTLRDNATIGVEQNRPICTPGVLKRADAAA